MVAEGLAMIGIIYLAFFMGLGIIGIIVIILFGIRILFEFIKEQINERSRKDV